VLIPPSSVGRVALKSGHRHRVTAYEDSGPHSWPVERVSRFQSTMRRNPLEAHGFLFKTRQATTGPQASPETTGHATRYTLFSTTAMAFLAFPNMSATKRVRGSRGRTYLLATQRAQRQVRFLFKGLMQRAPGPSTRYQHTQIMRSARVLPRPCRRNTLTL